jgi:hypothetical protein
MSDSELKVTDRRMFTRDGELREESVREAETLQTKTRGNLEVSEQAALDDVLYRLRTLYVDKTTP